MKATQYMEEELVIRKGIDLLMNGLGPLETIRFINISRDVKIDSVKRHRSWQRQLDKKSFFDAVFSEKE